MIISNNFLLNIRCENIVDITFLLSLFDGFWKMWHKFKSFNSMQYIICLWDFKGVSWVGGVYGTTKYVIIIEISYECQWIYEKIVLSKSKPIG